MHIFFTGTFDKIYNIKARSEGFMANDNKVRLTLIEVEQNPHDGKKQVAARIRRGFI